MFPIFSWEHWLWCCCKNLCMQDPHTLFLSGVFKKVHVVNFIIVCKINHYLWIHVAEFSQVMHSQLFHREESACSNIGFVTWRYWECTVYRNAIFIVETQYLIVLNPHFKECIWLYSYFRKRKISQERIEFKQNLNKKTEEW